MSRYEEAEWVLCFGGDIMSPSVVSTNHYALSLLKDGKKVLWVNPLPFRVPSLRSSGRTTVLHKIRNKLRTHSRPFRKVRDGFYVLSPVYIPFVETRIVQDLNALLLRLQLAVAKRVLGVRRYFLWVAGSMTALPIIKRGGQEFVVYQAADVVSDFRGASPRLQQVLTAGETELCKVAAVVFAASQRIVEKLATLTGAGSKIVYAPHGVEFEHFAHVWDVAEPMRSLKKPTAGYYGSLSDANDQEVFCALAADGFTVVAIGKVTGDYSLCRGNRNIVFLGPVPYETLPAYGTGFDVCLLNWRMAEWIRNCNPKKTLEYLALGKPVVSVRIPELEARFSDLIYFADTPRDFVTQCKRALAEDSEDLIRARRERARAESWDERFRNIRSHLLKI